MNNTKYNISQAARITGKSRTTITKHMKSGKLSYEQTEEGKEVDASELLRVYGEDCKFDRANGNETDDGSRGGEQSSGVQSEQGVVTTLQAELDREIEERKRERDQYMQQVEHLKELLERAEKHATLLLEDRSGNNSNLQQSISAIESRLAAHEEQSRKEIQQWKQRAIQVQRELKQEKSKTFWQRLFA